MSDKITIEKQNNSFFYYGLYNIPTDSGYYDLLCEECDRPLDSRYAYIVKTLEDHKLLPVDFKLLCCYCYENKDEQT